MKVERRSHTAYSYDSSDVRDAILALMDEFGQPSQRFGIYFVPAEDPRSVIGRKVETEVLVREPGADDTRMLFGNNEDFGIFERSDLSEFVCCVDHESLMPVGASRLIRNSAEMGCPTFIEMSAEPSAGRGYSFEDLARRATFSAAEPSQIVEVASIAVYPSYRKNVGHANASVALIASIMQRLHVSSAKSYVFMLSTLVYESIQKMTAHYSQKFDGIGALHYEDWPDSELCWANVEGMKDWFRQHHPERHETIYYGQGLEDFFFGYNGAPLWGARDPDREYLDVRKAIDVRDSTLQSRSTANAAAPRARTHDALNPET